MHLVPEKQKKNTFPRRHTDTHPPTRTAFSAVERCSEAIVYRSVRAERLTRCTGALLQPIFVNSGKWRVW